MLITYCYIFFTAMVSPFPTFTIIVIYYSTIRCVVPFLPKRYIDTRESSFYIFSSIP